jgi:hypothetical protein
MMGRKYTDKQIELEADKIFMKMNPQFKLKDGTFPRAYSASATPKYNREYDKVYSQVYGVRSKK